MSLFAKKSYGQHFLNNDSILQKIADRVAQQDINSILEIGPGRGALTNFLLRLNKKFLAVEADRDMQNHLLHNRILTEDQLICEDVLKTDFTALFDGNEFLLCGNFPYNISSQILIKTLLNSERIPVMIGMFQKEVVMRIISVPSTKEYGKLSVMTQLMYEGIRCFDINPSAFTPAPKVMSSVLELRRKSDALSKEKFLQIQKLVRTSFQFRRKTLRNNLKSYVQDPTILADSYFDQRPEELSPSEFLNLLSKLHTT